MNPRQRPVASGSHRATEEVLGALEALEEEEMVAVVEMVLVDLVEEGRASWPPILTAVCRKTPYPAGTARSASRSMGFGDCPFQTGRG
jgi:hypothetical protein